MINWTMKKAKVSDLLPTQNNPRKISAAEKDRLRSKIEKLGLFEAPTVDVNNELLNFNQRLKVLIEMGLGDMEIDIRVPDRKLTDEERKQIILSSNIHEGQWDEDLLRAAFADINLDEVGLDIELDIEEVSEKISEQEEEKPVYPIVAKFSEKYTAFVIVCDNELDENFIKAALKLDKEKSYKSQAFGVTHVISSQRFIIEWNRLKS